MEQRIRERFNNKILQQAVSRYGIQTSHIRALDAYESFVYEFERDNHPYILRLSHSLRRSEALIAGEVDFINYLAAGGVSVARAVDSVAGRLVEAIDDGQGGQFLATAFVRIEGQPPHKVWSPELYADFGVLLGSMHALAVEYQPANPAWMRPAWDDDIMDLPARYLPATETVAKQKYQALCERVRGLPTHSHCYGLTHFDAHDGNCLVDGNGRLTIFDFDDCTYTWYINDLAIAIGNLAWGKPNAEEIVSHLFGGYQRAFPLDLWMVSEIPTFLKMGEIFYLAVLHRDYNGSDPDHIKSMLDLKHNIEHDVPTLNVDFVGLAQSL